MLMRVSVAMLHRNVHNLTEYAQCGVLLVRSLLT